MKDIYLYMLRKNIVYAIAVTVELVAVYILLNLSFSCILQSGTIEQENGDAVTLFSYIAAAAMALYVFTVAIQNVVGYARNSRFYQVSVAMGATKKLLVKSRIAYGSTVYGVALFAGIAIVLWFDFDQLKEDGIKFFTFAGHGITFAVYVILYALNTLADVIAVKRSDVLKDLLGGTDNV